MTKAKSTSTVDLTAMAASVATQVLSKGRKGSSRYSNLDRFVTCLLDEDGNPTIRLTRNEIAGRMALTQCLEQAETEEAAGDRTEPFSLDGGPESEDFQTFVQLVRRAKNNVTSAVAKNQNATSISYNEKYKNVWQVVKDGNLIGLAPSGENGEAE